ncbi:DUF397 domain-containing protein [Actinoplanes sp. LDG1-06]|uniref:DUF397 domain-containing protein n=1 Tax=Paractinoplanes ovalisporus TaxID=2810368 RepID=A0ABS2AI20_9ACTN|nr:DUF397 domain-containing protein [Actinoplanes ovalisporus]MBM2618998.1 DUF397 domain-containing protein [Actinoplanes ovalisporus]
MTDLTGARWHKATRSGSDGNCVEVAENLPDIVAVRDTKNRNGATLIFTDAEWQAFIGSVKDGEFDL